MAAAARLAASLTSACRCACSAGGIDGHAGEGGLGQLQAAARSFHQPGHAHAVFGADGLRRQVAVATAAQFGQQLAQLRHLFQHGQHKVVATGAVLQRQARRVDHVLQHLELVMHQRRVTLEADGRSQRALIQVRTQARPVGLHLFDRGAVARRLVLRRGTHGGLERGRHLVGLGLACLGLARVTTQHPGRDAAVCCVTWIRFSTASAAGRPCCCASMRCSKSSRSEASMTVGGPASTSPMSPNRAISARS